MSIFKKIGDAVEKAAKDVAGTAEETGKNVGKTVEKAVKDTGAAIEDAAQDTGKTLEKAGQDTGHTLEKAAQDTGKAIEKALRDIEEETARTGRHARDAVVSAGHFLENQAHSWGDVISDAEKRLREGKLVDAIWHVATDPLRHTEAHLAQALGESTWLNGVATAAASIYGGPGGAAAYAAWMTYQKTGDLSLALKAGIIAGATKQGLDLVNGMPSDTIDELTRKMLASASIGGAAIAASGGEEREVIEAFVKGAALTLAREHYRQQTDQDIAGKAPSQGGVAKLDPKLDPEVAHQFSVLTDENGHPILSADGNLQIDIRSMPRDSISHVGLATADTSAGLLSGAETSMPMELIAKLPYMNDMAYYHDQWAAVAQMSGFEVQATILPALILTVTGSDTPIIDQATKQTQDLKD